MRDLSRLAARAQESLSFEQPFAFKPALAPVAGAGAGEPELKLQQLRERAAVERQERRQPAGSDAARSRRRQQAAAASSLK
jgi:hypothetical protein